MYGCMTGFSFIMRESSALYDTNIVRFGTFPFIFGAISPLQ